MVHKDVHVESEEGSHFKGCDVDRLLNANVSSCFNDSNL